MGSAGTVAGELSCAAVIEIADGSTVAVLAKSFRKEKKESLSEGAVADVTVLQWLNAKRQCKWEEL